MGTASVVILPVDTANIGKSIRTITKASIHEHLFIQDRRETILGVYGASMGAVLSVAASAQNGTSTAAFWWTLPNTVSNKAARLRFCAVKFTTSAVTPVMLTAPRFALGKFTFGANASGAQITSVPMQTSYPADVVYLTTAATGMSSPTLVNSGFGIGCATCPPFLLAGTAASATMPTMDTQQLIQQGQDNEDLLPRVVPGEGLVLWQADAGTASEIRKFTVDLIWDVIDTSGA
jgi:hypothetical protein